MLGIPVLSKPPCITLAIVVAPAVDDILAALARVTGACEAFGVAWLTSRISASLIGAEFPATIGNVLVDARD